MREITLSNDPFQSHILAYEDKKIKITVRYLVTVSMWYMDVSVDDVALVKGLAVGCGTVILNQNNTPFGFYLVDNSTLGIDPFRLEDFSEGRVSFLLLERADMAKYRGYNVK